MDAIIALNAKGVALLHDGKSQEACSAFRHALKDIALIIKTKEQQQNQDDAADAADDDSLGHKEQPTAAAATPAVTTTAMMTTTGIRCIPVSVHQDVSILDKSFSPENTFEFYHKVFHVEQVSYAVGTSAAPPAPAGFSSCTSLTAVATATATAQLQLSAALLYNWGAANHCVAICKGKSVFLQKALLLYNKAFGVLECSCCADEDEDKDKGGHADHHRHYNNKETRLLRLALLNNMEHVNCYFGNKDNVDVLQDRFHFVLHETDDVSSSSSSSSSSLDGDDCRTTTTTTTLEEELRSFFYYSTILWEGHYSASSHPNKDSTRRGRSVQSPAPAA
jgi:hypothetical protein